MRPRRLLATVAVAAVTVAGVVGCGGSDTFGLDEAPADRAGTGAADYVYEIPAGTGERIDAGESIDILPARLDVDVGQVIEITNNDDRGHLVGPFFVGAHERVRQEFTAPGEFEGICSVHSSGQILIVVS
ncbi:MAG: hypothetical protein ACK5RL_10005 [Acidimicrobiales bacterium]